MSLSIAATRKLFEPQPGPVGALPESIDVVVVGAGPIGLTVANLLGRFGIHTLLIEKSAATADAPRAIMIDDEYLRLLDSLGLTPELAGHLTEPVGVRFYSAFGFELARVEGGVTPSGFGARCAMGQPYIEKLLLKSASRFQSVLVRYRTELLDAEQSEQGVRLLVRTVAGDERYVEARYLLGCDGAHSQVRKRLGFSYDGHRIDQPHLVVDLAAFPDPAPFCRFHCDPRRPFNSIPAPYGGRRIEFMLLPGEHRDAITSAENVARLIRTRTRYKSEPIDIIRALVYGFSARMAVPMSRRSVFLLGDAAHIMPPFGGQGMNAGGRDAANLCWKIAHVLQGRADPRILESYNVEREPHVRAAIDHAVREGRLANIRFWPVALLRDLCFAVGNCFPSFRRSFSELKYLPRPYYRRGLVVHHGPQPSAVGQIVPRPLVADVSGLPEAIDTYLGSGYALIGIDVSLEALERLARAPELAPLQARCVHLSINQPAAFDGAATAAVARARVVGKGAAAERAMGRSSGHILLVRPDRYVAVEASPQDIPEALSTYLTLIRSPSPTRSDPGRPERS